jgi:hypothetical protein
MIASLAAGPATGMPAPAPASAALRPLPPLHAGTQGISPAQAPSADRLIDRMLEEPDVDFTSTWRQAQQLYEIRSATGTVDFQRVVDANGVLSYPIVKQVGTNPVANQDPTVLATLADQVAAAGGPNLPVPDANTTFPDAYRRISQVFDSPRAPTIAYSTKPGTDYNHPHGGTHGNLDVVQSRAPLIMAGPGIRSGATVDTVADVEDVAPTIADALGVARTTGYGPDGQLHPGQLLKWQDGHSLLSSVSAPAAGADAAAGAQQCAPPPPAAPGHPDRAVVIVLDGMNQAVLYDAIQKGLVPNIARIAGAGTTFRYGDIADSPSVTWVNHNALVSGAEPGHTDIVNNAWLDPKTGKVQMTINDPSAPVDAAHASDGQPPQDGPKPEPEMSFSHSFFTGKLLSKDVETLYEAVDRTWPGAPTASLNDPSGRGAKVATLELHGLGTMAEHLPGIAKNMWDGWRHVSIPELKHDSDYVKLTLQDDEATSIGAALLGSGKPPKLSVFELEETDNRGHMSGPQSPQELAGLQEADRNVGRILASLDKSQRTASTMFVITADHGMEPCGDNSFDGVSDAIRRSGVQGVINTVPFLYLPTTDPAGGTTAAS